jgi:hypothetical protein
MERMLDVKEVGQILSLKDPDVIRRKMREMIHMEGPLRVSESALQAWINQRTYRPAGAKAAGVPAEERIPRRRGGKLAV